MALLAGLPHPAPEAELEQWIRQWTAAEIASLAAEVETSDGDDARSTTVVSDRYADQDGRRFAPLLLIGKAAHETRLAGVLVMHRERPERALRDRELPARIATQLLEHGDVEGVPIQTAFVRQG